MRGFHWALVIAMGLVLGAGGTAAADSAGKAKTERSIFLNGVNLNGVEVPQQEFKSCTVRFDAQGNIHITAPGFKVAAKEVDGDGAAKQRPAPKQQPKPPAKLTRTYFLIAEPSSKGRSGYDVTVYINGERLTTVRADSPVAMDITEHVRPGDNKIELIAKKKTKQAGPSERVLAIKIGEGEIKDGQAIVRKTVMSYRRSAAETADYHDRYHFAGR